ncbi:MAG: Methylmalonyl-CoA carboxyltransferase 5S subunit [Chloroflexi bacterium ADurb.Bin344]|nr:MAG: Methylmalonyl-CoA carboxyltransferase 5S subunit [Chloroflexi bacterium ADurb.Bin344]
MTKKVLFNDLTLRDGHQSCAATRMTTEQAMRVLPIIKNAGYNMFELWGGATLDSAIRFTKDDPWERLERFRDEMGGGDKIQSLLRGQNLFAYSPYPDDLLAAFIRQSIESGSKNMRIFDAMNDVRNLWMAILATKAYGGKVEAAMCYTTSPIHTTQYFVDYGKRLLEEGVDRIAIKDMAGLLHPKDAVVLFPALRKEINVPIVLHTHTTTGVALVNLALGMKYGLDQFDTCISPFAGGPSHSPIEVMAVVAERMGFEHDLDKDAISKAQDVLRVIFEELKGSIPSFGKSRRKPVYFDDVPVDKVDKMVEAIMKTPEDLDTAIAVSREILADLDYPGYDDKVFITQIPGGMISNLQSQMKEMGVTGDMMDAVMEEFPKVRKDVGYVPLVTPTSQIVGSQAAFNVLAGERYAFVSNEFKMILRGEFGKTPGPIDEEFRKKILGDDVEVKKYRPASYLMPVLEDEVNLPFIKSKKDLLLHHVFGNAADEFLKSRK